MEQIDFVKKIEFACLLERLQTKLCLELDSDIVSNIYELYEGSYNNYTLFELLYIILEHKINITHPWNKKSFIEMIETQKLDIPKKYESKKPSTWKLIISEDQEDYSLECNDFLTISNNDIIQSSDGNMYEIMIQKYEDEIYVYTFNLNTDEELYFFPQIFVNILDYDDVTIIKNKDKDLYEGPYGNYTLIELLHLLNKKNIEITCSWNKNAIIEMIETNSLDIPKKYDPLRTSTWEHDRRRISIDSLRYDYLYVTSACGAFFEFTEFDQVRLSDGNIYEIQIQENEENEDTEIYVYMYCLDTNEELYVRAEEFVRMLDYEDVTIIRNREEGYNL
jgi:hypothetical protein